MHRPRYEFRQRRRELQKALLIASTVFVVLPFNSFGQSASMPSNPGELPASPWDYRGPNAARSTANSKSTSASTRRTANTYIQQPSSKKTSAVTPTRTEEVIATPQPILQPPVPISSSPQPEFRLDQPTSTERPSGLGAPIEFPIDAPKSLPEEIRPLESSQGESLISGQWNTLPHSGLILTSERTELEEPISKDEPIDLRQSGAIKPAQPIGLPPVPKKEIPLSTPIETNTTAASPTIESTTIQGKVDVAVAPQLEKPTAKPTELSYLERKQEALDQERLKIGQKVSTHILADSNAPSDPPPPAIEPPNGWNAVKDQLQTHLRQCDEYLRRGATHTARQEALFGLRLLFRALDQRRNAWTSEPDLDQALTAFREEADFHASMRNPEMARSVSSIVATHQTPVLKSTDLTNMAPEIAAQYYRYFAKDRLVEAAERHVWAADLFYSYGKCLEKQAAENEIERKMLLAQSVACYRAALETTSNHADSANQLGYVLLLLDQPEAAKLALEHSLKIQPTASVYRNLAELHRRTGDSAGHQWAVQQSQQFDQPQLASKAIPIVQQVDPATFAQLSPYPSNIPYNNIVPNNGTPSPNAAVPAPNVPNNTSSRTSWMTRIFR